MCSCTIYVCVSLCWCVSVCLLYLPSYVCVWVCVFLCKRVWAGKTNFTPQGSPSWNTKWLPLMNHQRWLRPKDYYNTHTNTHWHSHQHTHTHTHAHTHTQNMESYWDGHTFIRCPVCHNFIGIKPQKITKDRPYSVYLSLSYTHTHTHFHICTHTNKEMKIAWIWNDGSY